MTSLASLTPLARIRDLIGCDLTIAVHVEGLNRFQYSRELFGGNHAITIHIEDGHQRIRCPPLASSWSTAISSLRRRSSRIAARRRAFLASRPPFAGSRGQRNGYAKPQTHKHRNHQLL